MTRRSFVVSLSDFLRLLIACIFLSLALAAGISSFAILTLALWPLPTPEVETVVLTEIVYQIVTATPRAEGSQNANELHTATPTPSHTPVTPVDVPLHQATATALADTPSPAFDAGLATAYPILRPTQDAPTPTPTATAKPRQVWQPTPEKVHSSGGILIGGGRGCSGAG